MNNTKTPEWEFFEYSPGEKRRDSSSSKHFGEQSISNSLVRELVQNSLDAVSDDSHPVRIHIRFMEIEMGKDSQYFDSLKKHYEKSFDKKFPKFKSETVKFLIIEDFNTTGLEGEKANNFFRKDNIRTSTNDSSGGSHGIGKIVFYHTSKIRTFFAYSVFKKPGGIYDGVFEGTCDFKTHTLNTIEYKEDGVLKLPYKENKSFLQKFFKRTKEQTGLSIAIPLPDKEVESKKLEKAILEEYYYPIINRKLIVEIQKTTQKTTIDANYILEQNEDKYQLISAHSTSSKPEISVNLKLKIWNEAEVLSEEQVKDVISKLDDSTYVSIRMNIPIVCKRPSTTKEGCLYFLICKKEDDNSQKYDFWRENLLIQKASQRNNKSKQYAVIVLIYGSGNELSTLLRKLENPSHTRWDYQNLSSEVKASYNNIPQLVPFITQLPNKVTNQLKKINVDLDNSFFSDIFPESFGAGKKPSKPGNSQPVELDVNNNYKFIFTKIKNGFTIKLNKNSDTSLISNISIELAYGTNIGNPFKNYDRRDFDLAEKDMVSIEDGEVIEKNANKLICSIDDINFKLSIVGFDADREVKINIQEIP